MTGWSRSAASSKRPKGAIGIQRVHLETTRGSDPFVERFVEKADPRISVIPPSVTPPGWLDLPACVCFSSCRRMGRLLRGRPHFTGVFSSRATEISAAGQFWAVAPAARAI